MKAVVLRVGRDRKGWAQDAAHDYLRRMPRELQTAEQVVKPVAFRGDVAAVRDAEATRLLDRVKPDDVVVALDERGAVWTTEQFRDLVGNAARGGTRRLVFAIGGPYGHGPALRRRADHTLALGKMVVNHELARILVVEQLYRVSTLLWGGSYHH